MEAVSEFLGEYLHTGLRMGWHWFNTLSREEWLIVLGFVAAGGFLCMRGFGSRAHQ